MKRILACIVYILAVIDIGAVNELIERMGLGIPQGDFYSTRLNMPVIMESTADGDYSIFSRQDVALCNYYESLVSFMLYDKVENQDEKLGFNSDVIGADHFTTLSMKAIYNVAGRTGIADADNALEAIGEELGDQCWQYVMMSYVKMYAIANAGKVNEAYDFTSGYLESLKGSVWESDWLTGCIYTVQAALLTNQQRHEDSLIPFFEATKIWDRHNTRIINGEIDGLCAGGMMHLGNMLSQLSRSYDFHKEATDLIEAMMPHVKAMEFDRTGLADEMRCNIANIYYKEKNYRKSRPMMEEYLEIMRSKGLSHTPSYKEVEKMLKKTPKK